jgi:surface antigen
MIPGQNSSARLKLLGILLLSGVLASCTTTSGSTRLDQTGERMGEINGVTAEPDQPESAAFYIQALRGGLVARVPGLKISKSDRVRALEAEYKALESAPSGQKVLWDGAGGMRGEVIAAVPYQVGSQNCRQYVHTLSVNGGAPLVARGAACRNPNGSWTPLS